MKKLKIMSKSRLEQWKTKHEKLSDQREKNINRYILPIEIKMQELKDKIRKKENETSKGINRI